MSQEEYTSDQSEEGEEPDAASLRNYVKDIWNAYRCLNAKRRLKICCFLMEGSEARDYRWVMELVETMYARIEELREKVMVHDILIEEFEMRYCRSYKKIIREVNGRQVRVTVIDVDDNSHVVWPVSQ